MAFIKLLFLGIFLGIVAYLIVNFGLLKPTVVVEKDWINCKYWDSDAEGPEDITKYDHRTVLFSQGDFMSVYIVGDLTVPGSIWAIYDADTDHYQASPLPISGFPEDIAFHPHGIHIREVASKKLLYVINHAYDRGGDRVEVFKIIAHPETSTLSLEYEYSIDIGPKWLGNLNDLIVPEDDHLLITHYIPYPDAETGRPNTSLLVQIKTFLVQAMKLKTTHVISCRYKTERNHLNLATCEELENTAGAMVNGMDWDGKENVWVADSIENKVTHYRYNKASPRMLEKITEFATDGGVDNIDFDKEENKLYLGTVYRVYDFLAFTKQGKDSKGLILREKDYNYWSQCEMIDLNQKSPKSVVVLRSTKIIKAISGFTIAGNNMFLTSWGDVTFMTCQKSSS